MAISASDMAGLSGMFDSAGALQAKDIANKYKLGTATLKNNYKIAQLESKDRRKAIEAETLMNRERIAQARAEMEQIGIPQMLINKFVAEKTAEIAQQDMDLKKEVAAQDYGLKVGEMTGTFNGAPTQAAKEFAAKMGIDEGTLTGIYNGMPTLAKQEFEERARQFSATFGQEKLEQDRRFGLDVSEFKAQLASTPDTYFQSKQFNANDLPRLMGQMQPGSQDLGSPTPGIARMGEMLQYGQGGMAERQPGGSSVDPNNLQRDMLGGDAIAPPQQLPGGSDVNLTGAPQRQAGGQVDPGGTAYTADQQRMMSDMRYVPPQQQPGGSDVNLSGAPVRQAAGASGVNPQTGMTDAGWVPPQQLPGGSDVNLSGAPVRQAGASGVNPQTGMTDAGWAPPQQRYGGSDVNLSGAPVRQAAGPGGSAADPQMSTGYYAPNADDRQKQIAQVAKASPPSPYDGLDDQDTASLKLMESIYKKGFQGLPRGEIERLSATGRLGFLKSAGNLLGYSPDQEIAKYNAYAPSQGDARLA